MILMGSNCFFHQYADFKPADVDKIEIVDTNEFPEKRVIRGQGKDYFYLRRKPKDQLIQDALNSTLPMVVGKFLIPEFNAQIGFTIEDLPRLQPLIDRLDEKHKYEEIIYNAYLANKAFTLTEEQRLQAYNKYKEVR